MPCFVVYFNNVHVSLTFTALNILHYFFFLLVPNCSSVGTPAPSGTWSFTLNSSSFVTSWATRRCASFWDIPSVSIRFATLKAFLYSMPFSSNSWTRFMSTITFYLIRNAKSFTLSRKCNGFCQLHYKNIIIKSVVGIRRKFDWVKCWVCDIFYNFRCLKSYLCPCCHEMCNARKSQYTKTKAEKRKQEQHRYDLKNKFKFKIRDHIRTLEARAKKVKNIEHVHILSWCILSCVSS